PVLARLHEAAGHPLTTVAGRHGEVVHPATVPVVADHGGGEHGVVVPGHPEHRGLRSPHGAEEVRLGVVPRPGQPGLAPQGDSCRGVRLGERSDRHSPYLTDPRRGSEKRRPSCGAAPAPDRPTLRTAYGGLTLTLGQPSTLVARARDGRCST